MLLVFDARFKPTRHEAEDQRVVKWLVFLNGQRSDSSSTKLAMRVLVDL